MTLSAEAEDSAPQSAERACPAEVFEHNAANSSVPLRAEICIFGDEERLAEKPRCGNHAKSAGAGSHQKIEEERKLLVWRRPWHDTATERERIAGPLRATSAR